MYQNMLIMSSVTQIYLLASKFLRLLTSCLKVIHLNIYVQFLDGPYGGWYFTVQRLYNCAPESNIWLWSYLVRYLYLASRLRRIPYQEFMGLMDIYYIHVCLRVGILIFLSWCHWFSLLCEVRIICNSFKFGEMHIWSSVYHLLLWKAFWKALLEST